MRFNLLFLQQHLRGILELLVFEQAIDQLGARVFGVFALRERVGRQERFRFDVDQRGGHVDEVGGDIDVVLFELMDIFQILAGNFGDGDIVNIDVLLANQVEQQVERAFVLFEADFIAVRRFEIFRSNHDSGNDGLSFCGNLLALPFPTKHGFAHAGHGFCGGLAGAL